MSDVDITQKKDPEETSEGNESNPDTGTTPEQDSPTAFYKTKAEELEAQLKAKDKELEQARYTLSQKRVENKEKKLEEAPAQNVDAEEIAKKVREQLAEEQSQKFRESLSTRIEDVEELAQVEYFLDNVIKPTGNPEQDLFLARSLANSKKYEAMNSEMARAMGTKGKEADLSSNKVDGDGEAKLTEADKKFIELADSKKKK